MTTITAEVVKAEGKRAEVRFFLGGGEKRTPVCLEFVSFQPQFIRRAGLAGQLPHTNSVTHAPSAEEFLGRSRTRRDGEGFLQCVGEKLRHPDVHSDPGEHLKRSTSGPLEAHDRGFGDPTLCSKVRLPEAQRLALGFAATGHEGSERMTRDKHAEK